MQAIYGGTEVRGLTGYELDHEPDFPFGAIGLAAAAVRTFNGITPLTLLTVGNKAFRAALLVGMELVAYNGDETLVVKGPTNGGSELPTFDTSFTESKIGRAHV